MMKQRQSWTPKIQGRDWVKLNYHFFCSAENLNEMPRLDILLHKFHSICLKHVYIIIFIRQLLNIDHCSDKYSKLNLIFYKYLFLYFSMNVNSNVQFSGQIYLSINTNYNRLCQQLKYNSISALHHHFVNATDYRL